jgi:hypothetical protein
MENNNIIVVLIIIGAILFGGLSFIGQYTPLACYGEGHYNGYVTAKENVFLFNYDNIFTKTSLESSDEYAGFKAFFDVSQNLPIGKKISVTYKKCLFSPEFITNFAVLD